MTLNTNILLTTLIKIIKTSTGILITIFISRFFGNDILGKFLFGDKLIIVITAISSLFSRNFLIKKSSLISNDIKSIAINYIMYNFLLFIIIFLVLIALVFSLEDIISLKLNSNEIILFLFCTFFFIVNYVISALKIGKKKVIIGEFYDKTLFNILFALILVFSFFIKFNSFFIVAISYLIASLLSTLIILFKERISYSISKSYFNFKKEFIDSKYFYMTSCINFIYSNIDFFILSFFIDLKTLAVYGVCTRISNLLSFIQGSIRSIISNPLANLFKQNKLNEMQDLIVKVSRIIILIVLVTSVIIFFGGKLILGLWNFDDIDAYYILLIVSFGQLINFIFGNTGQILNMCDLEKLNFKLNFIFLFCYSFLLLILIPKYGIFGAAVLNASNYTLLNVFKSYIVFDKLKIKSFSLIGKNYVN